MRAHTKKNFQFNLKSQHTHTNGVVEKNATTTNTTTTNTNTTNATSSTTYTFENEEDLKTDHLLTASVIYVRPALSSTLTFFLCLFLFCCLSVCFT